MHEKKLKKKTINCHVTCNNVIFLKDLQYLNIFDQRDTLTYLRSGKNIQVLLIQILYGIV